MAFDQQHTFRFREGPEVSASLHFSDNIARLNISGRGNNAEATWTVDAGQKALKFDIIARTGTHAACIITCLGISVGKALLECLLNSTTIKEIENCLKEKAAEALADAAACIAHCLGIT